MRRSGFSLVIAFFLFSSSFALASGTDCTLYKFDFDFVSDPGNIFDVEQGSISDLKIDTKLDNQSLLVDKRNNTGQGFFVLDPKKYPVPNRFSIEADFKVDSNQWKKNAQFGFIENGNLWKVTVAVRGNAIKLLKIGESKAATLKTAGVGISDNRRHHLKLDVDGKQISVYLNGKKHISYQHQSILKPQKVGIGNGGSLPHATWFDNLSVNTKEVKIEELSINPDTLWPTHHSMVEVEADVKVTPPEATARITNVTHNGGTNQFEPDFNLDTGDPLTAFLRAERNGRNKDGRMYTVEVTASLGGCNTDTETAAVTVPHDQRSRSVQKNKGNGKGN